MAEVSENVIGEEALAHIRGEPVLELPTDLYIPPEALMVILEAFEGPLDLLLYLIRRQNLDILDIPVADITAQYIEYVELMQDLKLELAAEYLLMAAMLAEIKSRLLLPRPESVDEEEDDPRANLIRRLQEYERFKQAAEDLDQLPRIERDFYQVVIDEPVGEFEKPLPIVDLQDIVSAFMDVLKRADMLKHHQIEGEPLTVRERMVSILQRLSDKKFCEFHELFTVTEGRQGVVVSFLSILELCRESMIEIIQNQMYGPIHVKAVN